MDKEYIIQDISHHDAFILEEYRKGITVQKITEKVSHLPDMDNFTTQAISFHVQMVIVKGGSK